MSISFVELNKILHPLQTGRMFTMFMRAYLDESEEPEASIFAVGGFVGKATVWEQLQPKWLAALPPGVSYFHATDCFGGRGEFEPIDIPERVKILDDLTDLILEHEIFLIAGTLFVPTYKELAPKKRDNEFGGNKYTAPFEFAIERACHSMDSSPFPQDIKEQCAFIIERNEYSESAQRKIRQLQNNPHLWWRNRIGTDTYGTKTGPGAIPLLQVADLGAFLSAKKIAKAPQGKISWETYLQKLIDGKRFNGITHSDEKSLKIMYAVKTIWDKEQAGEEWDEIEEAMPFKPEKPEN